MRNAAKVKMIKPEFFPLDRKYFGHAISNETIERRERMKQTLKDCGESLLWSGAVFICAMSCLSLYVAWDAVLLK